MNECQPSVQACAMRVARLDGSGVPDPGPDNLYVTSGIITLTGVMSSSGRQAMLRSATLKDAGGQSPALSLLFFRATPASGTYTDNTGVAFGASDDDNLVGVVRVAAADWYVPSGSGKAFVAKADLLVCCEGSTTSNDLYMLIVADGAYDAVATNDLTVAIGFESV